MPALKVVCLISGGKDSFFSILHCLNNGHEIIALANLHPPQNQDGSATDDMDSYMYQTIGHSIIPMYEKALGLPLYRQEISGTHANQDKSYGLAASSDTFIQDETEALIPLLEKVKTAYPQVNAVSTGAILSDYQRTRVESVAIRLELTPLAYLWQWPNLPPHSPSSLLADMAAVEQDSRIVKVASGGLDESFLWQNVAAPQTIGRLERAATRFGTPGDGAVLGEGGEYETIAVAGPAPLWKARIAINEDGNIIVPSGAGAAYLRVAEPKLESVSSGKGDIAQLRTPSLLEPDFETLLNHLSNDPRIKKPAMSAQEVTSNVSATIPGELFLADLVGDGARPGEQTKSIMDKVMAMLLSHGHSAVDVAYTSIILRDMSTFAIVNYYYGSYFNRPNPPARVTIACPAVIHSHKHVMMSFTSVKHGWVIPRKGLHVQSRSYWAPANIGPYSQAIAVPLECNLSIGKQSIVFIAGQIPLQPATMDLPTPLPDEGANSFAMQTVLALQHFIRIGRVMQVREWISAIVFITAESQTEARGRSNIVRQAWEGLYSLSASNAEEPSSEEESESFDVWNVKFGHARQSGDHAATDKLLAQEASNTGNVPPLYVVKVDALPRGASVEWVPYGLTISDTTRPEIPHLDHLLRTFARQKVNPADAL